MSGSKIAADLQAFAECEHIRWRCEQCGCRTNGPGVDSLCNGNAIIRLNELRDLLREVLACGVSYRAGSYHEVQIPIVLLASIRAAVGETEGGG